MRWLFYVLTLALLIAWPELTAALYAVTTPWTLVTGLTFLAVRSALRRVQEQAARGWA